MRGVVAALCLCLLSVPPANAGPEESHSRVVRTAHFEVRYRPGSRAGAHAEAVAHALEHDLARIARTLEVETEGKWKVFVYDDSEELSTATGTTGNVGFSAGDTMHIPFDNPQTRLHELVHLVAVAWPATGKETRGFFEVEGLANAVLVHVDGVHVHAVAADLLRRNALPACAEMCGDFYAWCQAHPKLRSYDIAASFMRYLLETHGAERLRRYYTGTPAREAFGKDVQALEASWHKMLAEYEIRPEVALLLRQLAGEDVNWLRYDGIPADVIGTEADWTDLAAASMHPDASATWTRRGGSLHVQNGSAAWSACEFGEEELGDCAVRARVLTPSPVPVQVRLGASNQAMLVNGVFIYRGDRPVSSSQRAAMGAGRRETDLLVVRRGERLAVWVDGRFAVEGPATTESARPGVGIHTGAAEFTEIRVRSLPRR